MLAVKQMCHLPVVVDPSHACGKAWMVERMSLAAIAAGADGLIVEVHNDPKNAPVRRRPVHHARPVRGPDGQGGHHRRLRGPERVGGRAGTRPPAGWGLPRRSQPAAFFRLEVITMKKTIAVVGLGLIGGVAGPGAEGL